MAFTDLIGPSTKCRAVLEDWSRQNTIGEKGAPGMPGILVSSRHSVLNTGAAFGIGAVYADCFVRRGSHALPLARRTRTAFQRRFRPTEQGQAHLEDDIRLEERGRERARLARELHDTLLQGFLGASMLLDQAVEQTPADSPSKPALRRVLRLVRQAIDEGRAAIRGGIRLQLRPRASIRSFRTLGWATCPG